MSDSQGSLISSNASQNLSTVPMLHNLETVNEILEKLHIDKLSQRALANNDLIEKKIEEVQEDIRIRLTINTPPTAGDIVIKQMAEEFQTLEKNDQYRVLTAMPRDSTLEFLKKTFNVSDHQARGAKVIQAEQWILSTPTPKPGKRLSMESIAKVK